MKKIKTVFFGTHEFAVTILDGLKESPLFDIVLVITQPDKPTGRKKVLTPPPAKEWATHHNIPVLQPATLKDLSLDQYEPDISIVAQYGKIIPEHILHAARYHTINVHTSLLPKYRGASPIQSALIHGDQVTGVTIMQMDKGLDTGPILCQQEVPILPDETYLALDARLATIGANLLVSTLPAYIDGTITPKPQNDDNATHCSQLSREDGKVVWNHSAGAIYNQYRGMTPWPGIWTLWGEKRLKLLKVHPSSLSLPAGQVHIENGTLNIGTSRGSITVLSLQLEGKKAMDAATFISGFGTLLEGAQLG